MDEPAQQLLNKLREKDLPEALPSNNIIQYDVKWPSNGIDPTASQEHAKYIEKFCTSWNRGGPIDRHRGSIGLMRYFNMELSAKRNLSYFMSVRSF